MKHKATIQNINKHALYIDNYIATKFVVQIEI